VKNLIVRLLVSNRNFGWKNVKGKEVSILVASSKRLLMSHFFIETFKYLKANTKDCPKCHYPAEKNGGMDYFDFLFTHPDFF